LRGSESIYAPNECPAYGNERETAGKGNAMNPIETRGLWNIIKGVARQKWSRLMHNEAQYSRGTFEEFTGRIQMLTGETYRRLKITPWK
jgi:hypothetical protein